LNAALPIAAGSANAALFERQAEENKHISAAIEQMMLQQSEMTREAHNLQENIHSLLDS
jgi:hypothetical protein